MSQPHLAGSCSEVKVVLNEDAHVTPIVYVHVRVVVKNMAFDSHLEA